MYKVKEAADVLGVKRVDIFEILLSRREIFEPYVEKNNSITYISEEGLELLRQMLEVDEMVEKTSTLEAPSKEVISDASEFVEKTASPAPRKSVVERELESFVQAHKEKMLNEQPVVKTPEVPPEAEVPHDEEIPVETVEIEPEADVYAYDDPIDIEASDDVISQWLKEIQEEDAEADYYDEQLKQKRSQVTQLRNKILSLDSEIKRKDDAIRHYHEIMKDDLSWLEDLERKTQLIVKHGVADADMESHASEEDKGNFFKFFKR